MKDYDIQKVAAQVGIKEDAMRRLVKMFTETLPKEIKAIENAINEDDRQNIKTTSHKLKGAATNLGFKDLAEICYSIQINARSEAEYDFKAALSKLREEAEEIIAWHARMDADV